MWWAFWVWLALMVSVGALIIADFVFGEFGDWIEWVVQALFTLGVFFGVLFIVHSLELVPS